MLTYVRFEYFRILFYREGAAARMQLRNTGVKYFMENIF
jgi:hypothetical protein